MPVPSLCAYFLNLETLQKIKFFVHCSIKARETLLDASISNRQVKCYNMVKKNEMFAMPYASSVNVCTGQIITIPPSSALRGASPGLRHIVRFENRLSKNNQEA